MSAAHLRAVPLLWRAALRVSGLPLPVLAVPAQPSNTQSVSARPPLTCRSTRSSRLNPATPSSPRHPSCRTPQLNAANLKDRDLWAAGWLQMSEMQDPQGAQAAGGVTCRACSGSGATPCPVCDATGAVLLRPSALPGGPGGAAGAGGPLSSLAVVMGRARSPGPGLGAEGIMAESGEEGQEGGGLVEVDVEGPGVVGTGQVAVEGDRMAAPPQVHR